MSKTPNADALSFGHAPADDAEIEAYASGVASKIMQHASPNVVAALISRIRLDAGEIAMLRNQKDRRMPPGISIEASKTGLYLTVHSPKGTSSRFHLPDALEKPGLFTRSVLKQWAELERRHSNPGAATQDATRDIADLMELVQAMETKLASQYEEWRREIAACNDAIAATLARKVKGTDNDG